MNKQLEELKAAALAATPGRVGDRIDGSGSIKYECIGYDGSVVLRTDHKNMEYGFVGDNSDADELFFRRCVPDVILSALAELESAAQHIAGLESKLATPVRLPKRYSCEGYHIDEAYLVEDEEGDCFDRDEVIEALREQGFKVEGNA